MTYSVGSVIQASDYANIANSGIGGNAVINVNSIWNGQYGQTALSVPAYADTITATQWATLFTTVGNISSHTGRSISTLTNPVAGDTIAVKAQLENDIGNLYTARNNAASSGTQYGTFSGTISKTTSTGSGTTPWTITFTHTVAFANNTAFNNFFNSGGIVKWDSGKTSTGNPADAEWNDLASTLSGQLYFTIGSKTQGIAGQNYTGTTLLGNSTGASTLTTSQGVSGLTTSNTTVYQHYADTPPYTTQYIQVQLKVDNASTPTQFIITTTWVDPGGGDPGSTSVISGGTATSSPSTTITGTAPTVLVTYFPPETTYLTNSWGTPTITGAVS